MSVPAVFSQSRGLFFSNISTPPGGVNVRKLRTVPGTAGNADTPGSGVTMPILDPRDKFATIDLRDILTRQGCTVALFTDPHWYTPGLASWAGCPVDENGRQLPDPLLYRRQVSADVQRLLRPGDPVILDFEKVPEKWALRFMVGGSDTVIDGWRGRDGGWWNGGTNEARPTAYSCEPHQDLPVDVIVRGGCAYLAQLYRGNMDDVPAWQELQWLAGQSDDGLKLNPADCFPIYDARDYEPDEVAPTGVYLFDSNRLNWLFQ